MRYPGALSPSQLRTLQWSHPRFPYLAFVPLSPSYKGDLLGRLHISDNKWPHAGEPIIDNEHHVKASKWLRVEPDVQKSWRLLEDILYHCCELLQPHTSYQNIKYPKPPNSYLRTHDDPEMMKNFTLEARDAFLPLIALLSFLISQLGKVKEFSVTTALKVNLPEWIGLLITKGIHVSLVNLILASDVCDWSINRVGAVIDFEHCPFAYLFHEMIHRRVSLVYKWDVSGPGYLTGMEPEVIKTFMQPKDPRSPEDVKVFGSRLQSLLERWRPIPTLVQRPQTDVFPTGFAAFHRGKYHDWCLASTTSYIRSGPPINHGVSDPTPNSMDLDPPLSGTSEDTIHSRQLSTDGYSASHPDRYESRKAYFREREKKNREKLGKETPAESVARELQENCARTQRLPGQGTTAGVHLWESERIGQQTYEMRKRLTSSALRDVLYLDSHAVNELKSHYDALSDEWDLWYSDDPQYSSGFGDDPFYSEIDPPDVDVTQTVESPHNQLDDAYQRHYKAVEYVSREEFFRQRQKKNEGKLEGESLSAKSKREGRERSAADSSLPGANTKATVYLWEESEGSGELRQRLTRREYFDFFA